MVSDGPPFEAAAGASSLPEPAPSTIGPQEEEALDGGARPRADAEAESLPTPVFCDAPARVLMVSCGNGSCHSNRDVVIGDFALSPERAAAFVDRVSVRDPSCGRIIDSRSYGDSLLLTKVTGTFPLHCGGRMPVGSFTITDDQIACLASWLQQFQL